MSAKNRLVALFLNENQNEKKTTTSTKFKFKWNLCVCVSQKVYSNKNTYIALWSYSQNIKWKKVLNRFRRCFMIFIYRKGYLVAVQKESSTYDWFLFFFLSNFYGPSYDRLLIYCAPLVWYIIYESRVRFVLSHVWNDISDKLFLKWHPPKCTEMIMMNIDATVTPRWPIFEGKWTKKNVFV